MWNSPYYGTKQVKKLCKEAELKINRDERKKITYYKLQMPWKILKPFSPNKDKRFLFSMVIMDNDGDIPDRKWFYYGENIAVRKSMAGSHTVTLI